MEWLRRFLLIFKFRRRLNRLDEFVDEWRKRDDPQG